jgi:hypothetical protein
MVLCKKKKTKLTFITTFESLLNENLKVLGWRDVPDVTNLGQIAAEKNQP